MARNSTQQPPKVPSGPYATRRQLAEIHLERFGVPISHRTLERWPLPFRIVNGYAVCLKEDFLAEAERRFNDAPVIMHGHKAAA